MACEAHIEVDFQHRIGNLEMSVSFQTSAPWTVLFGPSASGKSTVLRAIAGLEQPDYGKVTLRGTVVSDSDAKIWVPAHKRPVRWAGQWPYLTPRKVAKWQMTEGINSHDRGHNGGHWIDELERLLDHFGLRAFEGLKPDELSGGQRQMVSVVRAAAGARGRVLLLDEPFAGLDALVRDRLIDRLRSWLGDTPILSVTHDIGEAFLLDAHVVRIAEGRVVARGPVAEVLAEERKQLLSVLQS